MLEIRLLGQFDLRRSGETLSLPSRPAQSLLAYLVLNPGASHRREQLAGLLAPDAGEVAARNALRHAIWRIRKTLGPDPHSGRDYLVVDEIAVAFDATARYWLDVGVVCARLPPDAAPQALVSALSVYAGDLLPGFYDDWIVLERERIEAAFENKMRVWLERQAGAGCWDEVFDWGERWIALGHSPESAYCALMLAHAARGDASRVAAVYQRCVGDLRASLDVAPAESTRRLYEQLVHGDGVPVFSQAQVIALPSRATGVQPPSPAIPGPPPFKGLEPFDVEDAPLFFGREALTSCLLDRLQRSDLLIVVGASGCGKSSLVRAGLVSAVMGGELATSPGGAAPNGSDWACHLLTPTGHPLQALALAVTGVESVLPAAALSDDMMIDARSLQLFLARQAAPVNGHPKHTLLVVDQFEEVFTLCPSEEERSAFIANLMHAVSSAGKLPDRSLRLVIALRADFYGHCAAYPELRRALETSQQYIGGMDAAELRRCIEGPLEVGGWQAEPGLVDLLVWDAGDEPGALPLLSHALLETWRGRTGRVLTLEGYAATGGVHGAIARTADAVYAQFDAEEQAVARRIFLRLTALGDGVQETRRRIPQEELLAGPGDGPLVESVLHTLAAARLITLGAGQVEMAHEALIREWPVLRQWLAEDREGLQLHRRVTVAAEAWEASHRDTADLYRGIRLAQAIDWAGRHPAELNPAERAFLDASQAEAGRAAAEREAQQRRELEAAQQLTAAERARAEEQQRNNRELRRRALLLAVALVFLLATTSLAMIMWSQARKAAEAAKVGETLAFVRELSASADASLAVDPQRAILLALEAVDAARAGGVAVPTEAEAALHHALQASPLDASIGASGTTSFNADGLLAALRLGNGPLEVWNLPDLSMPVQAGAQPRYSLDSSSDAFELSPDDRLLAVAGAAGGITLYDAPTGASRTRLRGHDAPVIALRFSRDGSRMVSAGGDGAVRTWDTSTGEELMPLVRPSAEPRHIDISADGSRIVADLFDGGVNLWDPEAGQRVLYVIGHQGEPWAIAFCGGPARFVVGSGRAIRLWDATSGQHLRTIEFSDSQPRAIACSLDGLRLAAGAAEAIRVWDIETGRELAVLATGAHARRLSFSADGARLLVQGEDGSVALWDLQGSRELVTLGAARSSSDVAFSPDGAWLGAGVGEAGAFGLWEVPPAGDLLARREEGAWLPRYNARGHENMVSRLAFDPAGSRLATGSLDDTVRLWELPEGAPAAQDASTLASQPLARGTQPVADLAFDRAGARLAVASATTVRIWDVTQGTAQPPAVLKTLKGLPFQVPSLALAWSPDGTRLAIGLGNGEARIVGLEDATDPISLLGHDESVLDVAYSPDGSALATASADGSVRIWDVGATGQQTGRAATNPARTLRGHASGVSALAFSPDGMSLVTAGEDGSVEVWDSRTGRARFRLATLPAPVTGVAFSPDGRLLATSGDAVRVFLVHLDDLVALARQRAARALTVDECVQYLHAESGGCGP